jgi:hypothetical protein
MSLEGVARNEELFRNVNEQIEGVMALPGCAGIRGDCLREQDFQTLAWRGLAVPAGASGGLVRDECWMKRCLIRRRNGVNSLAALAVLSTRHPARRRESSQSRVQSPLQMNFLPAQRSGPTGLSVSVSRLTLQR